MQGLVDWLRRLSDISSGADVAQSFMQVMVPGMGVLDLNNWLISTGQYRPVPPPNDFPEALGVIRLLDKPGVGNGPTHHRLAVELAAAMSLATMRRVEVPYRIAATVEGQQHLYFLPYTHLVDRGVTGPLPADAAPRINAVLESFFGLQDSDLKVIGASATLFHSALLLFDRDVRSAYMLLVAGIETLSRSYGSPPDDWSSLDQREQWDHFMESQGLSSEQPRPCARSYYTTSSCDSRPRSSRTQRVDYHHPSGTNRSLNGCTGSSLRKAFHLGLAAEKVYGDHVVRDFLTDDRAEVERALGESYNVRSKFIHNGTWFGPLELSDMGGVRIDTTKPLPFAMLRAILGELLLLELCERSVPAALPDIKLTRPPDEPLLAPLGPSLQAAQPSAAHKKNSGKPPLKHGRVRR